MKGITFGYGLRNDYWDRLCAARGFTGYRYRYGRYGWIMIGARDDADALNEAKRSTGLTPDIANLQRWDGAVYVPCAPDRLAAPV